MVTLGGSLRALAFVVGAMVATVAGTGMAQQPAKAAPNEVVIDDFRFTPTTLTVAPGTKVTWTNHDGEPHTVVNAAEPKLFKSPALDTDDKFTFVFDKPGTYKYFCSVHPRMTGTIVVK